MLFLERPILFMAGFHKVNGAIPIPTPRMKKKGNETINCERRQRSEMRCL